MHRKEGTIFQHMPSLKVDVVRTWQERKTKRNHRIILASQKIAILNPKFCQILPQKIGKFCHKKLPNLPHFAIKTAKFCKLSFLFKVDFGPGGPEY